MSTDNDFLIFRKVAGEKITELINRAERAEASLHAMRLVCGTTDADKFSTWVDRANARAERAEAAETVALVKWNGALERAMKAEADLAALEQCHDDNCRAVVKIAAELTAVTAERDQLRAELATERARLDWLMAGGVCLVQHSGRIHVSRLHAPVSRADIDAAMKEDAK